MTKTHAAVSGMPDAADGLEDDNNMVSPFTQSGACTTSK
jgi:hypothetical protein